jgi:hypothetical protein
MPSHVEDCGGRVIVTCKKEDGNAVDLTGGTITFHFRKPDASAVTKTASITNSPGTDGVAHYVKEADFQDAAGRFQLQVWIVFSASDKWHSDWLEFQVGSNLP